MKKLLLTLVISSIMGSATVNAENAFGGATIPERLTIVKFEGSYLVGGEESGTAYANAQKEIVNKLADERIAALSGSSENNEQNELTINQEREAALELLNVKAAYADLAIEKMESGISPSEAKKQAADETFGAIETTAGLQTGYNDNSVTSALTSGEESATVANNHFKQFNELDCSYSDVSNYIDKSLSPKTKAFSTSPSYSENYKAIAIKSAAQIKGEEEAACQTIFDEPAFTELPNISMADITSGIPTFGEFGSAMNDLGNKAGEQLSDFTDSLYATLREGFCTRLSTEYLGDLAGDLVDEQYRTDTTGTPLDGTKITEMDSDASQKNFTYTIINNQSKMSDSDLIKAIDISRAGEKSYQESLLSGQLDSRLDALENDIFGG